MTARENLATVRSALDQVTSEHRRLAILELLDRHIGYTSNDRVIADCLVRLGLGTIRDVLRADLEWLNESSLIRIEPVENVVVVTLLEGGQEVAQGRRADLEGIARPALP